MNLEAQAPTEVVRLRPGAAWPRAGRVLVPMAVEPLGRRAADAPVVDAQVLGALPKNAVVALDHAGPVASSWSKERALGPSDIADAITGRRPQPLDDAGWRAIEDRYREAAAACAAASVDRALVIDDDGLLHATLSPRTGHEDLERVLAIHRACGGCDVILVVEELAPRGLDATDGIRIARALVGQGAKRIYATAGTRALPVLKRREGGARHMLASASWLQGRVDAEIIALVPAGDVDVGVRL